MIFGLNRPRSLKVGASSCPDRLRRKDSDDSFSVYRSGSSRVRCLKDPALVFESESWGRDEEAVTSENTLLYAMSPVSTPEVNDLSGRR